MNLDEVLELIQFIFDTIRKYFLLILGKGDEVENETTTPTEGE